LQRRYPELLPKAALEGWLVPPQDIAGISEQQIATLGHVDVVICGWPCQGVSRANRNPQGLWDARSHVFFDVVRIVQVLGQRQKTGVGYMLEHVATGGDDRPAVRQAEEYFRHVLGDAFQLDAARVGAHAFRVRRYWTNLALNRHFEGALEKVPMPTAPLQDILPAHLEPLHAYI
jgi:hypothetical protein